MSIVENIEMKFVVVFVIIFGCFINAAECSQDLRTLTLPPETTVEPHSETTTPPESTTVLQPNTTAEPITTTAPETTTYSQPQTTSEPHSNSTTETNPTTTMTTHEPKPETTTETQPETTTETKPETTTATKPETTTEQQHESTTSTSVDTSTAPERETTTMMTPTSSKSPNTPNKYVVRDNDEVCIVLQGEMIFDIPFQKMDGTNGAASVSLPSEVEVKGTCNYNGTDTAQEITLTFFNTSWVLDIIVAMETHMFLQKSVLQVSNHYSWKEVTLSYVLDSHFRNPKNQGQRLTAVAEETFGKFKANSAGSYKCTADQTVEFGKDKKMKLDLSKMQYRAFGETNSTEFSKTGVSECPEDSKNNGVANHKTLGVALGCSFAALVVIVFVACGVKRYRKKKQTLSYASIE